MMEQIFSEAIKVKDGVFFNLQYHIERANRTSKHFFGQEIRLNLSEDMIPENMGSDMLKCRVVYAHKVLDVEFIPYTFRQIKDVQIVRDNNIDYSYKRTDRNRIHNLLKQSGSDDIIIIKNGNVTDASSSNLVFEDETGLYTPSSYLLQGTKREYLLDHRLIMEKTIKEEDIKLYSKVYFINAMIDLEDQICLDTKTIAGF